MKEIIWLPVYSSHMDNNAKSIFISWRYPELENAIPINVLDLSILNKYPKAL